MGTYAKENRTGLKKNLYHLQLTQEALRRQCLMGDRHSNRGSLILYWPESGAKTPGSLKGAYL